MCLSSIGAFTGCGGTSNSENSSNQSNTGVENSSPDSSSSAEEEEKVERFIVDLVESGDYEINSEISYETAAGVYNGTQLIEPTVTVTYGTENEAVTAEDCVFTLDKIGTYTITYNFTLPDNTTETYTTTINSKDTTAPTIVGKFSAQYLQGDGVDLSEAVLVMDNYDAEPETTVNVYCGEKTKENLVIFTEGKATFDKPGDYVAVISSKDNYNNVGTKEFNFTVVSNTAWSKTLTGTTAGGTVVMNTENVERPIGGESKQAVKVTTTDAVNYASAVFTESNIIREKDVTVSFKIYNSTSYAYTFRIYAFSNSVPTTGLPKDSVIVQNNTTVGAGESITVTFNLADFVTEENPYLAFFLPASTASTWNNGEKTSEQYLGCELYFYDFTVEDRVDVPVEEKEWYETMTGVTAGGTIVMNTENVETPIGGEAVAAVKITTVSDTSSVGNYLAATFSGSNVLLGKNTLKFKIYNPTAYEYTFRMHASTLSTATSDSKKLGTDLGGYIKIPANASTEYTIDLTKLTETNCYLMFYLPKYDGGNWGTNATNYNACELYMYDFNVTDEVEDPTVDPEEPAETAWHKTLTGTNANGTVLFNVETDATKTINDTQVSDVVVLKTASGHTLSMPVAVFAGSNTIDWANSTVTFKIYNPTDNDYTIRLYATSNATAFNYGTGTVAECSMETRIKLTAKSVTEITVKVSAFTETCQYLGIYIPWSDDKNWANGGQDSEKYLGCELYLYDFAVTAKTE